MSKETATGPKGLDLFQLRTIEFLTRLSQNPKPILGALGVIVVAIGIGFGINFYIKNKQENRRIELSKIDQVFDDEIKAYTKQREEIEKKRDALKAAQTTPAAAANPAVETPDTPEIKALNDQIQALKPEHKASSEQYRDFFKKYPKAPEGLLAGLRYAAYAAEKKQLEEAQKVLEDVVGASQDQSIIQSQSLLLLIAVLEDRSEYDKALTYSDRLIKISSDEAKPRAILSKAQIYFLKKDFPNAQTTLNQLLSEYANSMEADRARNLLALVP